MALRLLVQQGGDDSDRKNPAGREVERLIEATTRAAETRPCRIGYVVGEVREVDSGVLPLALLADRTE